LHDAVAIDAVEATAAERSAQRDLANVKFDRGGSVVNHPATVARFIEGEVAAVADVAEDEVICSVRVARGADHVASEASGVRKD
jgi:hypothetical protein